MDTSKKRKRLQRPKQSKKDQCDVVAADGDEQLQTIEAKKEIHADLIVFFPDPVNTTTKDEPANNSTKNDPPKNNKDNKKKPPTLEEFEKSLVKLPDKHLDLIRRMQGILIPLRDKKEEKTRQEKTAMRKLQELIEEVVEDGLRILEEAENMTD